MMAKPELGTKRSCSQCGAKFYDLNRDPMTCPKCGAVFDVASLLAVQSSAVKVREKRAPEPDANEEESEEALVDLEEADAEETDTGRVAPDIADDDVEEVEDDEALGEDDKADEFLEDDEDDDDVSVLIEGDIEDEED